MLENEIYIKAYLNSKSNHLSFYVSRLLNPNLKESEESFIIEKISEFIIEVENIIQKMNIKEVSINPFFNQLVLLKNKHLLKVDKLLYIYDYENKLKEKYNSIKERIIKDEIPSEEDQKTMEFLIFNHLIPFEDQKLIFEFYIKYILFKQPLLSIDAFKALMIDYTKMLMSSFVEEPIVIIKKVEELENKYGYSYQKTIYLCQEELEQMYILGVFRPLKIIFYELCHVSQYSKIYLKNEVSKDISTMIKDDILSIYIQNYYEDNFEILLSEVEAEDYSIEAISKLFADFGIAFKNNRNPYKEAQDKLKQAIDSNLRAVDGQMVPLDEIFDSFIVDYPELLNIYPQLALEYTIAFNGLVVKNSSIERTN